MGWFWKKNKESEEREFEAYLTMIDEQLDYLSELINDYDHCTSGIKKLKIKSSIRARCRTVRNMLKRIR